MGARATGELAGGLDSNSSPVVLACVLTSPLPQKKGGRLYTAYGCLYLDHTRDRRVALPLPALLSLI